MSCGGCLQTWRPTYVYILVDGDETYEASLAPAMVEKLLVERLDVINCRRLETDQENYRPGHRFGNRLLSGIVRHPFGDGFDDMLIGRRPAYPIRPLIAPGR